MGLLLTVLVILLIDFLLQSFLFFVLEIFRRKFKAKSIGCIFVIFRKRVTISFCIVLFVVLRFFFLLDEEERVSTIAQGFTLGNTEFTGYVTEEPTEKHGKSVVAVSVLGGLPGYRSNILVNLPSFHNLKIGQVCKFEGALVEPENFLEFDYKEYLERKNIYLISENPNFECRNIKEIRKGFFLRNILTDFKSDLVENVDAVLSEPQSSLLVGILFGQKRLFSNVFDGYVRMAGVSHVVAASGYNVSILVIAIGTAFGFLKSRLKITASLIAVWCFTLLSGLSSSIIRACIMLTISLLALFYGRGNSVHISLPLTTTIFLLFDPYILYDIGFQLSLSATFGLVYISPILQKIAEKLFQKRKFLILEQYVIPTMSCTISTLPVSVSIFQTFSIWSVPANTFILPIIENTMLWGFLSILTQFLNKPLSYLLYTVVNIQLKYFEFVVNKIGETNIGVIELSSKISSFVGISLLLVVLFLCVFFYPLENEKQNHYLKNI